jgi:hypothetical protein
MYHTLKIVWVDAKSSGDDDVMIWMSDHDDCYVHLCPLNDPAKTDDADGPCRHDDYCSCYDAMMIP